MELVLRNCRIVSLLSGEILPGDIEIDGGRIQAIRPVGEGEGREAIDCQRKYAAYGFADAHFHSESTKLSLPNLAEVLLPRGTTSLYLNPHEVANVGGMDAIRGLLTQAHGIPLRTYLVAPCKVPTAPGLEKSGAVFGCKEIAELLSWPETVGIGEMDAYKMMYPQEPYSLFVEEARERGLAVCGSISGLPPGQVQACIYNGVTDDHESVTGEEAMEKIRLGCYLHVREGSAEHNLEAILKTVRSYPACYSQLCFCCDDKAAEDLQESGHIDACIRKAIGLGVELFWAYRMGSYNTAAYFRQTAREGLVAPGRNADIVLLEDLNDVSVSDVFIGGKAVVRERTLLWHAENISMPEGAYHTVRWKADVTKEMLSMAPPSSSASTAAARVVEICPGQITTRIRLRDLPVDGGAVLADPAQNVQYFTLAERYCGRGDIVNAFVGGFGIVSGAMASSVAHDHHHLVCVGASKPDMAIALNRVAHLGGGQVVVKDGEILAELALPLWGLLSDVGAAETIEASKRLRAASLQLGWDHPADPFAVLSLICLPVIPEAGFTEKGLIDVRAQKIVPVLA